MAAAVIFQLTGLQHRLVLGLIGGAGYSLILLALTLLVDVRMYGLGDVKLATRLGSGSGLYRWSICLSDSLQRRSCCCSVCSLTVPWCVGCVPSLPGPAMVAGAIIGILVA